MIDGKNWSYAETTVLICALFAALYCQDIRVGASICRQGVDELYELVRRFWIVTWKNFREQCMR